MLPRAGSKRIRSAGFHMGGLLVVAGVGVGHEALLSWSG
jgi:hypothetical protein